LAKTAAEVGGKVATPAVSESYSVTYRYYVLFVLFLGYIVNVMDRGVLAAVLKNIGDDFALSDTQIGFLGSMPFAFFYSILGVPIAALADRTIRKNVLAAAIVLWSAATAACGFAPNFISLVTTRALTGVGEAGGSPPSHSLISDYFSRASRATALSIYALGVPVGQMIGNALGGRFNDIYGWRETFFLIGTPGILVGLLVFFTIREPPRGLSENDVRKPADAPAFWSAVKFLSSYASFAHMCLAAGLHSVVWYAGSQLNNLFFQRSHGMTATQAGDWVAFMAIIGAAGTLLGGVLSDRLSARKNDRRWYMWVPGIATLVMVPFQFLAYLTNELHVTITSFCVMIVLASMFFGPSFAVAQGLGTLRTRAVATSLLLLVQTLVGMGIGPLLAGILSDHLKPVFGDLESMRWALAIIGVVNVWAAAHYFIGARSIRQNWANTEQLNSTALRSA
jgi:MFS family permease